MDRPLFILLSIGALATSFAPRFIVTLHAHAQVPHKHPVHQVYVAALKSSGTWAFRLPTELPWEK